MPEKKRHDNARVADDERLARLTAHDAQIELHTDHEHEQHQADLADHVQRHERIDGSNRNSNAPGKKWPSTEGPSTIPATISPITPG